MIMKHTAWELQYDIFDKEKSDIDTVSIFFFNEADARASYNALREEKKTMPYFRDDDDGTGFVWARRNCNNPLMCANLYPNVTYYTADEPVSIDDLPKE